MIMMVCVMTSMCAWVLMIMLTWMETEFQMHVIAVRRAIAIMTASVMIWTFA